MSVSLDFDEFHRRLLDAARAAFVGVQQQQPDETFYAFSLFHEPLWGYIVPTANTEEGLQRVAEDYKRDIFNLGFGSKPIDALKVELRWNPGDWAYHGVGAEHFNDVNAWLLEHDIPSFSKDAALRKEVRQHLIERSRDVLKTLDADGAFGTGAARENVTLNIMAGDQDRSWLEHARVLNPPAVFARWIEELKAANLV